MPGSLAGGPDGGRRSPPGADSSGPRPRRGPARPTARPGRRATRSWPGSGPGARSAWSRASARCWTRLRWPDAPEAEAAAPAWLEARRGARVTVVPRGQPDRWDRVRADLLAAEDDADFAGGLIAAGLAYADANEADSLCRPGLRLVGGGRPGARTRSLERRAPGGAGRSGAPGAGRALRRRGGPDPPRRRARRAHLSRFRGPRHGRPHGDGIETHLANDARPWFECGLARRPARAGARPPGGPARPDPGGRPRRARGRSGRRTGRRPVRTGNGDCGADRDGRDHGAHHRGADPRGGPARPRRGGAGRPRPAARRLRRRPDRGDRAAGRGAGARGGAAHHRPRARRGCRPPQARGLLRGRGPGPQRHADADRGDRPPREGERPARPGLHGDAPRLAGGQRLRAAERAALRHPRPRGPGERHLRGGGRAGARDGPRDPQPRHRPQRARSCARRSSAASWPTC